MANRKRNNRNEIYLTDEEQFILEEKFKLSGLKNKSAFLRQLILYGYVYDVDYSYLRAYNVELGRISAVLNQIAARVNSTNRIYEEDMKERIESGLERNFKVLPKERISKGLIDIQQEEYHE